MGNIRKWQDRETGLEKVSLGVLALISMTIAADNNNHGDKNNTGGRGGGISDLLLRLDHFGTPIQFRHKNKDKKFRTNWGAILFVLALVGTLIFFTS